MFLNIFDKEKCINIFHIDLSQNIPVLYQVYPVTVLIFPL